MITKNEFEKLVIQYETNDFIDSDPVRFPRMFKNTRDIEIAGFLASLFAYGNRKAFIPKLTELFEIMQMQPLKYVLEFSQQSAELDNFDYRFSKGCDLKEIIRILQRLYREDGSSLEELFAYGWNSRATVKGMLEVVCDYFYSNVKNEVTQGFYHLIPDAHKSSALKRMNMFLRWMIRGGSVDLGVWDFIPKSELIIPLDTHVARLSVETGIVKKTNGDFKTALEITKVLKTFDELDPVKYDFALFGYGVDNK